jgi:hypothetical protein
LGMEIHPTLASSTALPAGKPAGETVPCCTIWWMSLGDMVSWGVARGGWGVACGVSGWVAVSMALGGSKGLRADRDGGGVGGPMGFGEGGRAGGAARARQVGGGWSRKWRIRPKLGALSQLHHYIVTQD